MKIALLKNWKKWIERWSLITIGMTMTGILLGHMHMSMKVVHLGESQWSIPTFERKKIKQKRTMGNKEKLNQFPPLNVSRNGDKVDLFPSTNKKHFVLIQQRKCWDAPSMDSFYGVKSWAMHDKGLYNLDEVINTVITNVAAKALMNRYPIVGIIDIGNSRWVRLLFKQMGFANIKKYI